MGTMSTPRGRLSGRRAQLANRSMSRLRQVALKPYPALAVLAVVTSLLSPSGPQTPGLGAGTWSYAAPAPTSYLTARAAHEFAYDVLAVAPVPLGARAWHGQLPAGLSEPPTTAYGPVVDLYHAYLVSVASASALRQYVPAHLGGARWVMSGSGSPPTPDSEEFSLAVSGPHEYSATLGYSMLALGGGGCLAQGPTGAACVLRLDAVTVWEPSRPAAEEAPLGDKAVLSAYSSVSVVLTRPVVTYTVRLGPARSRQIVRQFDSLPSGPGASCHEGAVMYKLAFRATSGQGEVLRATGQQCGAVVEVSVGGRPVHPLYDRECALLDLVRRFTPVKATGTRSVEAGCAQP